VPVIRFVCLSGNPRSAVRGSQSPRYRIWERQERVLHTSHSELALSNTVSQFGLRESADVTQQCEGGGTETGRLQGVQTAVVNALGVRGLRI
jgi:hypothetical protein